MNSNDVFVLRLRQNNGYIWIGRGASQEEEKGAEYVVSVLKCRITRIREGREPGVYCGEKDSSQHFYLVSLLIMYLFILINRAFVMVTGH